MFLEAGDTRCTYFNMAIYEAKRKNLQIYHHGTIIISWTEKNIS